MGDKMLRGIARNGNIRVLMVSSKDLVQEARDIHDTYPTVSAALGRTINASLMMAFQMKEDGEKLNVEIRGDGDLKFIIVNADNEGFVRATISNPHLFKVKEHVNKLDVGGIIGKGTLKVSRELNGKTVYNSLVDLQTGEIGDDFAYYFAQSEQIPSAVSLGVLVDENLDIVASGGMLIQILPTATEEDIVAMESLIASLKPMSTLLQEKDIYQLFVELFPDGLVLATTDIHYHCGCNHDQMRSVLMTLPKSDLETLLHEDKGATLECHYCHKQYHFSEDDLKEMLDDNH